MCRGADWKTGTNALQKPATSIFSAQESQSLFYPEHTVNVIL
jgi:hypothetical protein